MYNFLINCISKINLNEYLPKILAITCNQSSYANYVIKLY